MTEPNLFTTEHIELVGIILIPIITGIGYLIYQQAQLALKVETMWAWWSNHANKGRNIVMKDDTK